MRPPPRPRLPALLALAAVPLAELGGAWAAEGELPRAGLGLELGAWAALALGYVLVRRLASPTLPAVIVFAAAGLAATRRVDGYPVSALFAGVGVLVAAVLAARVLDDLGRKLPWAGLPLSFAAVIGARAVDLTAQAVPLPQLGAELHAPAWSLQAGSGRPPILLLTVDTLRADAAEHMPAVQALAARGLYWPRAMSTSSWTVPSLASLHTGALPGEHGAGVLPILRPQPIRAELPMLAERLRREGYGTAAFLSNAFTASQLGFGRGFDVAWHQEEDRPFRVAFGGAAKVSLPADRARRWLETAPTTDVFLWVHLDEPHLPWDHLDDPAVAALRAASAGRNDVVRTSLLRSGTVALSPEVRVAARAAYELDVADADRAVAGLLEVVARRWPDAIVVFTADHGEELWEHGGFEHGHSHHGEVVDIPLVVTAPGLTPARRGDLASLVDVAPTVLGLVGGAAEGLPGRDLRTPSPPDRVIYAMGNLYGVPLVSARQGDRRALLGAPGSGLDQGVEYDLAADPGEHTPLPTTTLSLPLPELLPKSGGAGAPGLDAAVPLEGLQRLGYME